MAWTVVARSMLGRTRKNMVNGLFAHGTYQGLKKMLDATVMRHEAIASNLANVETPNYRRIDVDKSFTNALQKAIKSGDNKHVSQLKPKFVVDESAISPNRDGNTVQLDKELINLQQNTLAHTLQTQLITGRLMKLKSAIQGRAS